jgi:hypothetical protein
MPAMSTFFRRRQPSTVAASVPLKSASIEAVIIRRDGTRVPLGKVAVYHRNPLIRAWQQFRLRRRMAALARQHPDRFPPEEHA